MRRSFVRQLVLAPAAIALPALACAASRPLVLWTMQLSPFHDAYVNGLIAEFEREHAGVSVKWVDVPWAEMERKTLAAMAAGTAPDVVNLNPQFAARLAELGVLHDPTRHLDADTVATYLPSAWRANELQGRYFALPWYLSTTLTLYNRELLERAGAAVPHTPAQLLATARALARHTGRYAWFPAMDGAGPLELLAATHGHLFDAAGCAPAPAPPGTTPLFESMRTLYAERLLPPAVLTEGHRGAVARFAAGEVAMIATGMQFLAHLRTNDPALYARIGVAPQLGGAPPDSPGAAPNIAAMNLAVPSRSREPRLAFALAAHVTSARSQLALARRVPLLPSARACYDEALFTQPSGDALLDEARAISARQVRAGRVQVPPLRQYHKLRASFSRGLQAAMAGTRTPLAAWDEVSVTWRALRACPA